MILKHFLHGLPGFNYLSGTDLEHIASAMRVDDFPSGHVFVYQDKLSRDMFLLLEGVVKVCHYGRNERYYTLKNLKPGDVFGLLSLSDGKPAAASCVADGPVRVASLPFSAYMLLYQPDSEIGCRFQFVLANQLARDLHDRHAALRNLLIQIYGGGTAGSAACLVE